MSMCDGNKTTRGNMRIVGLDGQHLRLGRLRCNFCLVGLLVMNGVWGVALLYEINDKL